MITTAEILRIEAGIAAAPSDEELDDWERNGPDLVRRLLTSHEYWRSEAQRLSGLIEAIEDAALCGRCSGLLETAIRSAEQE